MNLVQVLSETFTRFASKPAVIFEGRKYTYAGVYQALTRRSCWLQRAGVRKGDRVAVRLPKGMESIFWHLGILHAGAISLPLNPDYPVGETTYFLSDSGTSLLITQGAGFPPVQEWSENEGQCRILLTDEPSSQGWGPVPWELKKVDGGAGALTPCAVKKDDIAMILYTSGTTGKSKGAMITHQNLLSNLRALHTTWAWSESDILLHVLPLFHIHGLAVGLHSALHAGATVIMHGKFDPKNAWESIIQAGCTMLMGVPTIYHRMLKAWKGSRVDLKTMRLFLCGSAPLSPLLFYEFEEATGFSILERYGMTETGILTSNPLNPLERKPKTVGFALPGVRIRVVAEKGEDARPGEVGEVWVQGENIFRGYWQMPEKTKESFEEGWFKSGDLGYQDPADAGRLHLVGRAKELIITGGYNVYPKEVENILEQHGAIQEAAVIGIPDDDFGERVTAAVVFKRGNNLPSPQAIISFCKEHLASYKCPKEVRIIDRLPRNAMGKIQKGVLREMK